MKKNNFFWVSFSDLMTSLFFIMLVLFVVSIGYLQFKKKATEKQLEKIKELQTAVKQLPEDYFSYQPKYKRFKLNKQIHFGTYSTTINSTDIEYLIKVGRSIIKLIDNLDSNYKGFDIKYLVVIEGMASQDRYYRNFELSSARAFSLYKLWKENNIIFDPKICEIQIAGSGTDGVREYSGRDESKNQQFLIHIVPKIGKINIKNVDE